MTKVKLTNNSEYKQARAGRLPQEAVHRIEIDALVDTGATMLVLPQDVVDALDLSPDGNRHVRYADGRVIERPWVSGVRVEILGREISCDAIVQPVGTTPLIGQIPLEALDLIVDPKSRDVSANPASPHAPLIDILAAA